MATTLVGTTATSGGSDLAFAGDATGTKWTAVASGTADNMQVVVRSGSTYTSISLAIYADSAGSPGAKLGESNAITDNTAGTKSVALTATVAIVNGTVYWLCILPLGGQYNWTGATGGTGYKGNSGVAVFVDPFGATTFTDSTANGGVPILAEDSGSGSAAVPVNTPAFNAIPFMGR